MPNACAGEGGTLRHVLNSAVRDKDLKEALSEALSESGIIDKATTAAEKATTAADYALLQETRIADPESKSRAQRAASGRCWTASLSAAARAVRRWAATRSVVESLDTGLQRDPDGRALRL